MTLQLSVLKLAEHSAVPVELNEVILNEDFCQAEGDLLAVNYDLELGKFLGAQHFNGKSPVQRLLKKN